MSTNKIIAIALLLFVAFPAMVNAQTERKFIRKGNSLYDKAFADSTKVDSAMFVEAETAYRQALEQEPNSWDATYNLANTLMRQGKFEDAARYYQAAAGQTDVEKEKRAAAFHNLGNTLLRMNNLDGAINAFKNALRNNPNDFDTKYNLTWALDKKKQQENQQQQNQDQNKQDQNQDQQKDQNQQNQQNNEQENQQQQNQQQEQEQEQQQNQQQQQPQEQTDENQMSKEDAMRILEALENDEKDVQEKVQKAKALPQKRRTQKDW